MHCSAYFGCAVFRVSRVSNAKCIKDAIEIDGIEISSVQAVAVDVDAIEIANTQWYWTGQPTTT